MSLFDHFMGLALKGLKRYLRRLFASLELHAVFTDGVQLPPVEPSVGWDSPNAINEKSQLQED